MLIKDLAISKFDKDLSLNKPEFESPKKNPFSFLGKGSTFLPESSFNKSPSDKLKKKGPKSFLGI